MDKMAELIGVKTGRLTPIDFYRKKTSGKSRVFYICICECGNKPHVVRENIIKGITKSCGCYKKECASEIYDKHGLSKTKIYRTWSNMKSRALNEKRPDYKYYGGKDVKINDSWLEFINFKNDMYQSYLEHVSVHGEKNTTLDRIDGKGDYEKNNCRWATMQVQNDNKELGRKPFLATNLKTGETYKGISLAEISRVLGIHDGQIGNVLKGKRKQTCGYTFKYIEEIPV